MHSLALLILPLTSAHSWLVLLGENGLQRGGLNGTDLTRQRYYCPHTDFSKCTAASSNVTLPADSNRPCRQQISNPMAKVSAGSPLSLIWAGNGHSQQWENTCVDVMITPFAIDPSISSFHSLVNCTTFTDGSTPGTIVHIPQSYPPGQYTLFWLWDFAEFYYSSCADIIVTSGPPTNVTGFTSQQALKLPYDEVDCSLVKDADGYCMAAAKSTSYCIYWDKDTCGMSHCHGLNSNRTCHVSTPTAPTPSAPLGSYVNASQLLLPYPTTDCRNMTQPDAWCQAMVSAGSYCKGWAEDNCGRSHCFGRDIGIVANCSTHGETHLSNAGIPGPVLLVVEVGRGCESSSDPTGYCLQEFGIGSYCKTYAADNCGRSVCQGQGSLQPCA